MAEKNILILVKSLPYDTLNYYESLRVAAGLWEHQVTILWTGNGVYSLLKEADQTLTHKFLEDLPDLDVEMYVDKDSLEIHKIEETDIISEATIADRVTVNKLFNLAEASLVF
jgi:sulfur relay (sulfurtransferase) DsrF/TusC family protein